LQERSRDKLVAPARGDDDVEAGSPARVRKLRRRTRLRREDRIVAEDDSGA
jgi:hypothetical protein